jgi:hypothetical protein
MDFKDLVTVYTLTNPTEAEGLTALPHGGLAG